MPAPNITPQDVLERYAELKESGWAEAHNQMFKARRTLLGDILPPGVIAALDAEDLPAISYNFPKTYWRNASGAQRAARVDERVFPLQDGSKEVASHLSRWLKWHAIHNQLQDTHAIVYMDQWSGGMGVYENSRVLLDDPLGENQCVAGNALQHMFDWGGVRPDRRDLQDQMKEAYLLPAQVAAVYGIPVAEAASLLKSTRVAQTQLPGQLDLFNVNEGRNNDPFSRAHSDLVRGASRRGEGRVIEWYFRQHEPRIFLYDLFTASQEDVTDVEETEVAARKQALEAAGHPTLIVRANASRIYKVASTDTTILLPPQLHGPQVFPFVYSLGYRIGNLISGEVKDLVGPALGMSRALSSITDVISKSGNTSILTASDAELDEDVRTDLAAMAKGWSKHVNLPGQTQQPLIIQHGQFTPELFNYATQHEAIMRSVSGVTRNNEGYSEGSHQSGIHAAQMIQQGAQAGEVLRDNFLSARRLNAMTNIRMLQWYEGPIPFRTLRVMRDDDTPEEIQFNQQIGNQVLNDLSVGTYLVTVEQSSYTVTERHAKAEQVIAAFQAAQMPMPPDLIFKLQDDPDAEKYGDMIRSYQREQLESQMLALANTRR